MLDRSQLSRLITLALATCAVTWMLAAGASAGPYVPTDTGAVNTAPASTAVPGDTDKAPSASTAPAYQPQIGDALKTPESARAPRVLSGIGYKGALPQSSTQGSNDVDPLVVILSIVAVVTALSAVTLIVTRRQHRPVLPG